MVCTAIVPKNIKRTLEIVSYKQFGINVRSGIFNVYNIGKTHDMISYIHSLR